MILTAPLLKNIKKYNRIRLAKGLILDSFGTKVRQGTYGVSSSRHGDTWYMLNKGRAIFKTYKSDLTEGFFDSVQKLRMVNELICYELSKQVGVLCAEYELANYKGEQGIVTYDVAKKGESLLDGYEFFHNISDKGHSLFSSDATLEDYYDAMELYKEDGYNIDINKCLKGLYKIALFDCLTAQSDRHMSNLFFLVNDRTRKVTVAPMIDNEFAFNVKNFDEYVHRTMEFYETPEKSFNISLKYLTDQINFQDFDERGNTLFVQNAQQIVKVAMQNEEYAKIFKQIVKDFNVKKAIDKVKEQGVTISREYEEYMIMVEKETKKLLKKCIKIYKANLDKNSENYDYSYINKYTEMDK